MPKSVRCLASSKGYDFVLIALAVASATLQTAEAAGAASVFVIDSTGTLYSFTASGDSVAQVHLNGTIGNLNGGGIALAGNTVYVTLGQPQDAVVAFSTTTLAPVSLPPGAFPNLFVPRGIAYDPRNKLLYVGNGGSTVLAFTLAGSAVSLPGGLPGHYGPSGVAYDGADNTLWVANYFGATQTPPPQYSVTEYKQDGSGAKSFDYTTAFIPPSPPQVYEQPYAVAHCSKLASVKAAKVIVGFISDTSGQGHGEIGAYDRDGNPVTGGFTGTISQPNALSCSSGSTIFDADNGGLYRFDVSGNPIVSGPGKFSGLTAPIYGVAAR